MEDNASIENTVAAIVTPYAQGSIGIIKISGSLAKQIVKKVFVPANKNADIENLPGYKALFGYIINENGKKIDEAIMLNFNAPKSYTGEDVVELSVHSGLYILKKVLRSVLNAGAMLAQPGEFTKRAFLNGKLTLTQAESVMDIISAQNAQAYNAAFNLKQGALFNVINNVTNDILGITSHIAAFIDYPEEDVEKIDFVNLNIKLEDIVQNLIKLKNTYETGRLLKEGIDTAIVGKTNVGKSTIMNLLTGYNKSIVTDIPGTTRDIIEETILINDITLNIADTAGIRQTDDVIENIGVNLARAKLNSAYLIIAVFDNSKEIDIYDKELIESVKNKTAIAIINKSDLPSKFNKEYLKNKISTIIEGSALDVEFLKKFSSTINDKIGLSVNNASCIIASERQYNCLQKAINNLNEAQMAIKNNFTLDIIGVCVENALNFLLELNGQNITETILDDIFSKFCVGK